MTKDNVIAKDNAMAAEPVVNSLPIFLVSFSDASTHCPKFNRFLSLMVRVFVPPPTRRPGDSARPPPLSSDIETGATCRPSKRNQEQPQTTAAAASREHS